MADNLWQGKRFVPLLITQFLGAFNDNLYKNLLMTFVAYGLTVIISEAEAGVYSSIIAGVFILP